MDSAPRQQTQFFRTLGVCHTDAGKTRGEGRGMIAYLNLLDILGRRLVPSAGSRSADVGVLQTVRHGTTCPVMLAFSIVQCCRVGALQTTRSYAPFILPGLAFSSRLRCGVADCCCSPPPRYHSRGAPPRRLSLIGRRQLGFAFGVLGYMCACARSCLTVVCCQ